MFASKASQRTGVRKSFMYTLPAIYIYIYVDIESPAYEFFHGFSPVYFALRVLVSSLSILRLTFFRGKNCDSNYPAH